MLPRARSAPGAEPHTNGIWSTSFRLVVTWLTERTYVRTYASTDCTGRVGETIKRKGGVSQACLAKSTSFTLDIHNMVNWQLSKQDSHWPVSHDHITGSCVNLLRWRDLFGSCQLIILLDRDQCSVSYFPASLGSGHRKTDTRQCCDLLTAVKKGIRWPVSLDCIAGSGVDPSWSSIFWSYPLTSKLVFKWSVSYTHLTLPTIYSV